MSQLSTHLVYFWMPISLGIESGRMIMKHMRKSAKRWSVYQWYGISPSVFPVTVSYRDRHTETHKQGGKYIFVTLSCVYIYTFICYSYLNMEPQSTHTHTQLTFIQLILHNHQKGHRDHEEVENKADFTQMADPLSTHLSHHIMIRVLPTDWRGIAKYDQPTYQKYQRHLRKGERC